MPIYIPIIGGVISGLGKGALAASLGQLIKNKMNLSVGIIKIDPYLNIDCGTMNPDQHGEVFVTEDGKETDLDLGHYERFLDENLLKDSCMTMGQITNEVLLAERNGEFLGKDIQIVPNITDKIIEKINKIGIEKDVVIIEVGGTVGDYEADSILYAIKKLMIKNKCVCLFLSKLDCESGSIKTKPIQNSVKTIGSYGIEPDILIVRAYKNLTDNDKQHIKDKLEDYVKYILFGETISNIYDLPKYFESQGLLRILSLKIGISYDEKKVEYKKWNPIGLDIYKIAIAEKYHGTDTYISVQEAIKHIAINQNINIEVEFVDIESQFTIEQWKMFNGVIIPGAFGDRCMENKITLCNYLRENNVPTLGLCMGMQIMCIEFARNVCDIKNATSQEFKNEMITNPEYIVHLMNDQQYVKQVGGSMRLGSYPCNLMCDSIAYECYKTISINERHRHRYEFNNEYRKILSEKGMKFTGFNQKLDLIEIIELDKETHPFFVGVQFHSEFKSRPNRPHPLFLGFFDTIKKIRMENIEDE
jgi:CTP synthase